MNKQVKLILEIIGIGISFWGIIVFIKDEKTVYVISLFLVLTTIFIFMFRDFKSSPVTYLHNKTTYQILDSSGKRILHEKIKTFIVNEKNVTILQDVGYEASGSIKFISTSIGEMLSPTKDGGCMTFTTYFKIPLKKGTTYNQVIKAEYLNSFIESKESVGIRMEKKYKSFHLIVQFPSDRPCKDVKTFMQSGEKMSELNNISKSTDGTVVELYMEKPVYKARYRLEFDW